jgi:hypothetical protein
MISRRTAFVAIAGTILAGVHPAAAKSGRSAAIQMFDIDHDGTLDLQEVKSAASALFDRLDRDKEGIAVNLRVGSAPENWPPQTPITMER